MNENRLEREPHKHTVLQRYESAERRGIESLILQVKDHINLMAIMQLE